MISHIFDAFEIKFEAFWIGFLVLLDAFGCYFGTSGASWSALGSWEPPGASLDPSRTLQEASWMLMEPILGPT